MKCCRSSHCNHFAKLLKRVELIKSISAILCRECFHGVDHFLHFYCNIWGCTAYPKKYAHAFVVLCFVVVMQSFIMNSHEVFIHIHQGCFAGTGAIVRLPQRQWSKPGGYGKISQCITTTKHSKAKTVCIFLGIYCMLSRSQFLCCWSRKLRRRRRATPYFFSTSCYLIRVT